MFSVSKTHQTRPRVFCAVDCRKTRLCMSFKQTHTQVIGLSQALKNISAVLWKAQQVGKTQLWPLIDTTPELFSINQKGSNKALQLHPLFPLNGALFSLHARLLISLSQLLATYTHTHTHPHTHIHEHTDT